MAPGVHEDVERGVGARELLAVEDAEEGRVRQQRPEPGLLGPAADEHETHARDPVDVGQQLQLLLRGQPADVPDQEPAVGGELGVERLVAALRCEQLLVHAARPAGDRVHAEPAELGDARGGGRQRAVDPQVDPAGQRPHRPRAAGDAVLLREADEVGLVDRDRRDAERPRRPRRLQAERGG